MAAKKVKNSDFIERPLPSADEIDNFEKQFQKDSSGQIGLGETINDELLEIYEDASGNIIDVKKINIKRKRRFFPVVLRTLIILALVGGLLYGAYVYFVKNQQTQADFLGLTVDAPKEAMSGEDFFYTINYKNLTNLSLKNIKIEVTYPDNFVFEDSLPAADSNQNNWTIASLDKGGSGAIKVKGKIINVDSSDNLMTAQAHYYLSGFSTEFQKEASTVVTTKGLGLTADFNFASAALVGDTNDINVTFDNYKSVPTAMSMVMTLPDNISLISVAGVSAGGAATSTTGTSTTLSVQQATDDTWMLTGFDGTKTPQVLDIKYQVKTKTDDQQKINLQFETKAENGQSYTFLQKEIDLDIIKSNLNLTLAVNDSKGDQPVNFGDTLNYVIDYSNKGDSNMKDVVIMAAVGGDFVDWNSLQDKNQGSVNNGTITWTENEIPQLKELTPGAEGQINFSLKVKPFNQADLGKNFQVVSYAQFNIGNAAQAQSGSDNKSNTITNKINSDLNFKEQVRYFDKDNVPVGTGPLPPKVGQTTNLRVYWNLTNDLHELNDATVTYNLPEGVSFADNARTSMGNVAYDSASNKITWNIGLLPLAVYTASAEFSIAITPTAADLNKIMVLSNGSVAAAVDGETQATITKNTKPQTSKLDDDDIAGLNNDGRVQ